MCPYYLMFIEMIDWNLHSTVSWPIKKLLVQINQSSYLICFCHNFFNRAKETNIYEIKSRRVRSQIPYANTDLLYFSSIVFKNITVSLKRATLQQKMLQLRKNYIELIWMKLREFTYTCVHRWGMCKSHSSQWWWRTYWKY